MADPVVHADSKRAKSNAQLVVKFFADVLGTGEATRAVEYLSPVFVDHDPAPGVPTDRDGVVTKLEALWQAFPDGRFTLQSVVAAGDVVAARSVFTGTQLGAFGEMAPTHRKVSVTFEDFYRVAKDGLVEHWHAFDEYGMLQQLGALPGQD